MEYLCPVHNVPVKQSKFNDKEYWHKDEGMEKAHVLKEEDLKVFGKEKFDMSPTEVEDNAPMTKSEWREKDERIARLTLAKTFIQASVDFPTAIKDNDLKSWEKYVLTGEIE